MPHCKCRRTCSTVSGLGRLATSSDATSMGGLASFASGSVCVRSASQGCADCIASLQVSAQASCAAIDARRQVFSQHRRAGTCQARAARLTPNSAADSPMRDAMRPRPACTHKKLSTLRPAWLLHHALCKRSVQAQQLQPGLPCGARHRRWPSEGAWSCCPGSG